VHAGGSGHNGGEKRSVLVVSVLLPIAVNFALRSEPPGGVKVLEVLEMSLKNRVCARVCAQRTNPRTFHKHAAGIFAAALLGRDWA
jgi:hypothetical protein